MSTSDIDDYDCDYGADRKDEDPPSQEKCPDCRPIINQDEHGVNFPDTVLCPKHLRELEDRLDKEQPRTGLAPEKEELEWFLNSPIKYTGDWRELEEISQWSEQYHTPNRPTERQLRAIAQAIRAHVLSSPEVKAKDEEIARYNQSLGESVLREQALQKQIRAKDAMLDRLITCIQITPAQNQADYESKCALVKEARAHLRVEKPCAAPSGEVERLP